MMCTKWQDVGQGANKLRAYGSTTVRRYGSSSTRAYGRTSGGGEKDSRQRAAGSWQRTENPAGKDSWQVAAGSGQRAENPGGSGQRAAGSWQRTEPSNPRTLELSNYRTVEQPNAFFESIELQTDHI